MVHTQLGQASKAMQACQAALRLSVSGSQLTDLRQLDSLLTRFAHLGGLQPTP
jgi:hypothetical protein